MSKICSNCGALIEDDSLFCGECGTRVEASQQPTIQQTIQPKCPSCGAVLDSDSSFCPECGKPVNQNTQQTAPAEQNIPQPMQSAVNQSIPQPMQSAVNQSIPQPMQSAVNQNIQPNTPPPNVNMSGGQTPQQTPPPSEPKKDKGGMIACGCAIGCFGVFAIAVIIFAVIIYSAYSSGAFEEALDEMDISNDYDYNDYYDEYGLNDIDGIDDVQLTPNDDNDNSDTDYSDTTDNTSGAETLDDFMYSPLATEEDFDYLYSEEFSSMDSVPTGAVALSDSDKYLGEWKVNYYTSADTADSGYEERFFNIFVEEDPSENKSLYSDSGIPVKATLRWSGKKTAKGYEDISDAKNVVYTGVAYAENSNVILYLTDDADNIIYMNETFNYNGTQYARGTFYKQGNDYYYCEMVRP